MSNSPKKKILYVITKSNWGGAQRYVYDLVSNLKEEYDITVAFGGEGELKQRLDALHIPTVSMKYLERDVSLKNEFRVFFDLFTILKSLRPDIIHLNSSKIGGLGALTTRVYNLYLKLSHWNFKLGTKIVFTAHGWVFNENRSYLSKKSLKILHWITILLSDKTIAVSREMGYQMKHFFFVHHKMILIENGITKAPLYKKQEAQDLIVLQNAKLKSYLGVDPEKTKKHTWIGTISELHKNKGLEYSVQALSLLKKENQSFVFVIVGEGEERENLEKLVKEKELEDHVFFIGKIENANKYLNAFNIFTLTSITEGLPYALLEAGLAGLPVIASNVGGIPEIVDQLRSGILVRPRHPTEIKDAIIFLQQNKMKGKEFGKNLKLKIENEFTLPRMIEATKENYEKNY